MYVAKGIIDQEEMTVLLWFAPEGLLYTTVHLGSGANQLEKPRAYVRCVHTHRDGILSPYSYIHNELEVALVGPKVDLTYEYQVRR